MIAFEYLTPTHIDSARAIGRHSSLAARAYIARKLLVFRKSFSAVLRECKKHFAVRLGCVLRFGSLVIDLYETKSVVGRIHGCHLVSFDDVPFIEPGRVNYAVA